MTATLSASISTNIRPAASSFRLGRNTWLFFGCQALGATLNSVQAVLGTLIGQSLALNKALGSLPLTLQETATMAAALPAVILFERLGRRHGFLLGVLASLLGCLLFAAGVWRSDFTVYCIGAVPTGLGIGIAQHLRFATSEAVGPQQQARALALVMSGGIV